MARVRCRGAGMRALLVAMLLAFASMLPPAGLAAPPTRPAGVDVNIATADELQTVRGIGPSIAARIVEERARGPYRDLADLEARVKGIGPASVRRFAESGLIVSGASGKVVAGSAAARAGGEAAGTTGAATGADGPAVTTTPLGSGVIREYRAPAATGTR